MGSSREIFWINAGGFTAFQVFFGELIEAHGDKVSFMLNLHLLHHLHEYVTKLNSLDLIYASSREHFKGHIMHSYKGSSRRRVSRIT